MQEQPLAADMLQRAVDWIMANPDTDSAITLKRLLRALYELSLRTA